MSSSHTDPSQHLMTADTGSTVDELYDLYDACNLYDLYDLYDLCRHLLEIGNIWN